MESSWWQRLEQELEQQFDRFLSEHPNQKELLDQEHWHEQQRRKKDRLIEIEKLAKLLRDKLLNTSKDINQWNRRVIKAQAAGAHELSSRAEAHLRFLIVSGRTDWQKLTELGLEKKKLEMQLSKQQEIKTNLGKTSDLEKDWADFAAEQELIELKKTQTNKPTA